MAGKQEDKDNWFGDFLSPQEMRAWTQREIADAQKALELRTKELTELARAYESGEITPEKADELHSRYYHRWGEALPGSRATQGKTDQQILSEIDKAAGEFTTPGEDHRHLRRLTERQRGRGENSR